MTNPFAAAAAQNNTAQPPASNPAPDASNPAPTPQPSTGPAAGIAQPDGAPAVAGFANGSAAGGDKLQDLEGCAVLIKPQSYTAAMPTQHGPANVITGEWIALDGPRQGEKFSGMVFPTVIVNSLKAALDAGQLSVGKVVRGEAKAGKSAPWLLAPLEDAQLTLAHQAAQAHGWV